MKFKKFIFFILLIASIILVLLYYLDVFEKKIEIELLYSIPLETSPSSLNLDNIVDVKDAFRFLINKSQKSIYFAGLYITSNLNKRIIKDLRKAIKRGVKIKFLLQDSDFSRNEFKKLQFEKYTNVEVKFIDITRLGETKWGDFHNKYAIFDEKYAILGSANFSYPAFNSNIEINALIVEEKIVKQLTEIFFRDWNYAENKIPVYDRFYFISPADYLSKDGLILVESAPAPLNSPDILDIENAVVYLLENATNEILLEIYAFTSNETNFPVLYNSLLNAYKRGVDIKIIVDATIYEKNQHTKYSIDKLKESGINIKKIKLAKSSDDFSVDHSKLFIVDKKYALISSCNWSKSGFTENREIGILTSYTQIVYPLYKKFFMTFLSKKYLVE